MALIKLTAIVDNISGKLNGTVFAKNKGGHYMRSKSKPTNPRTAQQMAVRGAFGAISTSWRSLPEAARNAWNEIASDFPYINKLGDSKVLSGFALHQKLNRNVGLVGGDALQYPPAPQGTASISEITPSFTVSELKVEGAAVSELGQKNSVVIYATPAISPGVSNFQNRLRQIQVADIDDLGTGISFTTAYSKLFGAPVPGQKIGIAVRAINENTGEASVMLQTDSFVEE